MSRVLIDRVQRARGLTEVTVPVADLGGVLARLHEMEAMEQRAYDVAGSRVLVYDRAADAARYILGEDGS